MIGGKLLARGSSTCVFSPGLPCNFGSKVDNKKISKIIYSDKSKILYDREKEINSLIKKIKGYKKWCIIFDEYCKAPPYKILESYDYLGMKECVNKKVSLPLFENNSMMLNGLNGGDTLLNYFKNNFSNVTDGKLLEKKFLELMKMMRPLFVGLVELSKNKICHNDIKYNNIVYKNKRSGFKFIDFGLSTVYKDKDSFKRRSLKEFSTSRLYVFYPIEYIYYFNDYKLLDKEMNKKRKNSDIISNIYKIFNLNLDDIRQDTIYRLSKSRINLEELIKKIDIYSLGIQIPLLFIQYSNNINPHENNKVIQDFYFLFKEMCQPFASNRITPEKALERLDILLNNNVSKKRKKKKTKNNKKTKKKKK